MTVIVKIVKIGDWDQGDRRSKAVTVIVKIVKACRVLTLSDIGADSIILR